MKGRKGKTAGTYGYNDRMLLDVRDLRVSLINGKTSVPVIRGFDLSLENGAILGILGESGSGKTVSASMIMRLFEKEEGTIDQGKIIFKGRDLASAKEKELRNIRGREISFVFQNPSQALNPYKKIGRQLADTLKTHGLPYKRQIIEKALLEAGIPDPGTVYGMYPYQLSSGQNQRIMICQGIICKPDLLIADEPTSSIDASLRKRILDLFTQINLKYGMSIIFITHDFDIARFLCGRLVIMYGGMVVEEGGIDEIFRNPLHPYTEELIKCSQSLDRNEDRLYTLDGTPLVPSDFKDECPFYERCRFRCPECKSGIPAMLERDKRKARCLARIIDGRIENADNHIKTGGPDDGEY
ncbi:MAG: ABC transporter ATP-binding protein [Clostridia bacterium]|nr:ABC transporter ATP-binding protein [Clostridia bacterium]